MAKVLVVEDEPAILESLVYLLGRDGYTTETCENLACARSRLGDGERRLDLIVLDLMLPDGSGFELIEEARQLSPSPAIVVLSSRDAESDRVRALESGADDYVTKPFSPREVVARVRAVLRRLAPPAAVVDEDPLPRINQVSRKAHFGAVPLDLTRVEFDLLALLLKEPGRAYSRSDIIDTVWGSGFALSDRTIDSHIKALRKKIVDAGAEAHLIETVRGIGYRLRTSEDPS